MPIIYNGTFYDPKKVYRDYTLQIRRLDNNFLVINGYDTDCELRGDPSPPTLTDVALRYNAGKLKFELIPPEWLEELALILTRGAVKYADWNWVKSINTEDHEQFINDRMGSIYRHLLARQKGEIYDIEIVAGAENLRPTHLGAAAWNCLALMYYDMKKAQD